MRIHTKPEVTVVNESTITKKACALKMPRISYAQQGK